MQTNRTNHPKAPAQTRQGSRRALVQRRPFYPLSSILYLLSSNRNGSRRAAFTIIELLVVITIIGILMTLVIQVVGAFLTQARDSATKATINKNQGLINSRAQALNRLLMRNRNNFVTGQNEFLLLSQVVPGANSMPVATQKTLATKLIEMKYFPQNIPDISQGIFANKANAAGGTPTGPFAVLYNTYLQIFNQANPPGQNISDLANYNPTLDANHALRNSEILYHFLTQSNVLGGPPVGLDAFSAAEVKDTDGNGLPELIDAWGNPLRFYRWPTRFFRSQGVGVNDGKLRSITTPAHAPLAPDNWTLWPNPDGSYDTNTAKLLFASLPVFSGNLEYDLNRDPDDPLRNCVSINVPGLYSLINFEQQFHTPGTYHTLLIMSAGPDGQLGLYEPDDFTNYGYLAQPIPGQQDALTDNIMYLNVRAGGK